MISVSLSLRIRGYIRSTLWQFGIGTKLARFVVVGADGTAVVRGRAQLAVLAAHAVSDPTAAILPAFTAVIVWWEFAACRKE